MNRLPSYPDNNFFDQKNCVETFAARGYSGVEKEAHYIATKKNYFVEFVGYAALGIFCYSFC